MNSAPDAARRFSLRVRIGDAHLEYLVDGEQSHYLTMSGMIEASDLEAAPVGMPFDITFGDIDAERAGLRIGEQGGAVHEVMIGAQADAVQSLAELARGRGGALICDIELPGEGSMRAGSGLFWGAPRLTLAARDLFAQAGR